MIPRQDYTARLGVGFDGCEGGDGGVGGNIYVTHGMAVTVWEMNDYTTIH